MDVDFPGKTEATVGDSFDWPAFEGTGETATSEQVTDAVARGAADQ